MPAVTHNPDAYQRIAFDALHWVGWTFEAAMQDSTRREIEHAEATGKEVYYLTGPINTVYRLRTGPDGSASLRYRAFSWGDSVNAKAS